MNKFDRLKQLLSSFFVVGIVCYEEHHKKWWFMVIEEASTPPFIFIISCQETTRGHQPLLLILSCSLPVNWINPNLHQKWRFPWNQENIKTFPFCYLLTVKQRSRTPSPPPHRSCYFRPFFPFVSHCLSNKREALLPLPSLFFGPAKYRRCSLLVHRS